MKMSAFFLKFHVPRPVVHNNCFVYYSSSLVLFSGIPSLLPVPLCQNLYKDKICVFVCYMLKNIFITMYHNYYISYILVKLGNCCYFSTCPVSDFLIHKFNDRFISVLNTLDIPWMHIRISHFCLLHYISCIKRKSRGQSF